MSFGVDWRDDEDEEARSRWDALLNAVFVVFFLAVVYLMLSHSGGSVDVAWEVGH